MLNLSLWVLLLPLLGFIVLGLVGRMLSRTGILVVAWGAIGLALIDTVLDLRIPAHVEAIVARLQAGDASAARLVGLPTERFAGVPIGAVDDATRALIAPLVERAGLVAAFNDAWLVIGALILVSTLALPLLRPTAAKVDMTRRWNAT